MRFRLSLFAAAVVAALALAGPGAADHGPCPVVETDAPGHSEFAQEHIVPFAHAGLLGQAHKPGEHHGASGCARG